MIYGYIRVSTKTQKQFRQIDALKKHAEDNQFKYDIIYEDKSTRANFNRNQYQLMKETVKPGDEIIIKELDRFGGDYELIKKELNYFQEREVIVTILDIPSFNIEDPTLKKMITNIVIDLMGYIAEKELDKTKRRIAEGMASAKQRGVKIGRPKFDISKLPKDFKKYFKMHQAGDLKITEFAKLLDVSRMTVYRHIEHYEEYLQSKRKE